MSTNDLNLLPSLRALLEECNVTRAGTRVGLSQPAMSAVLARLRLHFQDELLVRVGNRYERTPLGNALMVRAASACDMAEIVFSSRASFDPVTTEHEFTLAAADYGVAIVGTELARILHREAPGISLSFRPIPREMVESPTATLNTVDGVLLPHGLIRDVPFVDLLDDTWVCIAAADNPEINGGVTLDNLKTLPWAVFQRPFTLSALRLVAMLGIEPRIEVCTESFHMLPFMVAGTRRVAMVQQRLAALLETSTAIRTYPCPFAAVPIREAFWWHPVHTGDPAHEWLRTTMQRVARNLTAGQPAPR